MVCPHPTGFWIFNNCNIVNSITSEMMPVNAFLSLALHHYQTMIPAAMAVITGTSELHTARSHTRVVNMVSDLIVVLDISAPRPALASEHTAPSFGSLSYVSLSYSLC